MSSRRSPRHPLALAVLLALASQAALADTSSVPAAAQQQRFDIPAGPLGRQLNLLASQAGILLGGNAGLTANKQSQAVQGATSVEQALAQMLAGTGLGAVRSGDREFQLIERPNDQALELGLPRSTAKGWARSLRTPVSTPPARPARPPSWPCRPGKPRKR